MQRKEFEILQNIENRLVLQCNPPKRQDYITKNAINKLYTDIKQTNMQHCLLKKKISPTLTGKH